MSLQQVSPRIVYCTRYRHCYNESVMEIKQIKGTTTKTVNNGPQRPLSFGEFIGQDDIKTVLQTAIGSAQKQWHSVWHILFAWQSGYGKTTLAGIVSSQMKWTLKVITGYALTKPSEMISLLNSLQKNDILFIDEIHRLRASVEEVLYIAMEDYCIDMVLPDGSSVRVPLNEFTLVGATTKQESLSQPLKNRFVYSFHLSPYSDTEKQHIINYYLGKNNIDLEDESLLTSISEFVTGTPREITSLCIQLRDYLIVHHESMLLQRTIRSEFVENHNKEKGWLTPLHKRYITLLEAAIGEPVGLKTLAVKLGLSEKSLEEDIEPLLFALGMIEKTTRGRVLVG